MTNNATIIIQSQLPNQERHTAAELYYHAFRTKLSPMLGAAETAVPLLVGVLDPELGLTAIAGGRVVGIAGLHHQQRQFVRLRFADLARHFGLPSAVWRYGIACLFLRSPRVGELMMDGIAVTEAMRGKGVGTSLLKAVVAFGQARQYNTVRLDVVDTNPGAHRLYERFGFVPTITRSYPFMRPFGFSAATTMVKSID